MVQTVPWFGYENEASDKSQETMIRPIFERNHLALDWPPFLPNIALIPLEHFRPENWTSILHTIDPDCLFGTNWCFEE